MKKIIKKPNKKVYKTNCQCGCEFTFEGEDLEFEKRKTLYQGEMKPYDVIYVTCPNCYERLFQDTYQFKLL